MSYAVKKDGSSWRAVGSPDDLEADEVFSEDNPGPVIDLAAQVRADRDTRLAATDWTQGKDIPDSVSSLWAPYRQALRDVTNQSSFPQSVVWPERPA